jgi:UDP-N-acetylmuramyl tripeptide synthase
MIFAGIAGDEGKIETACLINSIFSSCGRKISVVDSKNLTALDRIRFKSFITELEKNKVDILIMKLGISDIAGFLNKDIHFDIMIFTGKLKDINENMGEDYSAMLERAYQLLDEKGIAIVNVDDNQLVDILRGMKHHILTYGFNSKASITTSSIGDSVFKDGFICCLQRTISARNGIVFEPQEYKLRIDSGEQEIHNVLAAASFALVNGIDLNRVELS